MGKNKKKTSINAVGKIIKEAREKEGLRVIDVVWKINNPKITEKTIKAWESGKQFPDLDMIYKLSELFNLNPNELLKLRNIIQEESYSAPNASARHIGEIILDASRPVINLAIKLVLGISIIYLAANYKKFENMVTSENDPEQMNFINEKMQEQIDKYVTTPQNEVKHFDKIEENGEVKNSNENIIEYYENLVSPTEKR